MLGRDPATIEQWAHDYALRLKAFPLRSSDEVNSLLRSSGMSADCLDDAVFPGIPGGELMAGPSSANRADYLRVIATRV
jgi:hypothetical protein